MKTMIFKKTKVNFNADLTAICAKITFESRQGENVGNFLTVYLIIFFIWDSGKMVFRNLYSSQK